ncbi:MAG TPA: hypothetical protein VN158_13765 [Caulobacter sp.]|nr:hypothetical protein [Caulobacter sp.]
MLSCVDHQAAPDRVLMLEDNMTIALDLEDMLTRLGVKQVTMASRIGQTLEPWPTKSPRSRSWTSISARRPASRSPRLCRTPTYRSPSAPASATATPPDRFRDTPVLQKPYSAESVAAVF